ncbi:MAG: DUF1330 domain-containing protein [Halioglobus sp.]|nr:DUF1330 domain-containing protein [Halioglobus sp.]
MFTREGPILDQAAMEKYSSLNGESPAPAKLTPLVVYGALESLEGEAPDGAVVLQFPTMQDAREWYNSPEYQAAIPHRKKGANYRAFIVEGIA